jgi:hypothetical protein
MSTTHLLKSCQFKRKLLSYSPMATSFYSIATNLSSMGVQYATRAQATTLLKDQKQHLAVSALATNRLSMLAQQLSSCLPSLKNTLIVWIPFSLGLISACLANPAEKYLKQEKRDPILTALCTLTVGVGKACEFSLTYSHIVIDIACLVSYVAFIVLGFPVTGAIGLAGLALIAIKRAGLMPPLLDKMMEPLAVFAMLVAGFLIPTPLIMRAPQIFFSLDYFLLHLLKNWRPLPGKHIEIGAKPTSLANVNQYIDHLEVNLTSIFTKDLYCLHKSAKDSHELFKEIEERLLKEEIKFTEEEQAGYNTLRQAVIDGTLVDEAPVNLENLRQMVKDILDSILNEEHLFAEKIKEYSLAGNQCNDRWTSELYHFLKPNPTLKDYKYLFHYHLAQFRSAIIQESKNEILHKFSIDCKAAGGSNNTHLEDTVEAAVWHHFRGYKGEFNRRKASTSPLQGLLISSFQKENHRYARNGFTASLENLYIRSIFFLRNIAHVSLRKFSPDLIGFVQKNGLDSKYTKERIIDVLLGKVNDTSNEARREIPAAAIQIWEEDFSARNEWYIENRGDFFNAANCLNEKGLALILWDMGILQCQEINNI